MSGWGAFLGGHLATDDVVVNFAKGGATTRSFIDEGLWANLMERLDAGDIVLVQVEHNDQKEPELLAHDGGYQQRLGRFLDEVGGAGARAVLCTSVEQRHFEGGRVLHSHGHCPAAVRMLARERQIPLIDLTDFTAWLYEYLGEEGSSALFTPTDNAHFHECGADLVAEFVARSLRALTGASDDLGPMDIAIAHLV